MILTVLVGNTNTRFAWFNGPRLARYLILPTAAVRGGRLPKPGRAGSKTVKAHPDSGQDGSSGKDPLAENHVHGGGCAEVDDNHVPVGQRALCSDRDAHPVSSKFLPVVIEPESGLCARPDNQRSEAGPVAQACD